jgi:hypothetical protein
MSNSVHDRNDQVKKHLVTSVASSILENGFGSFSTGRGLKQNEIKDNNSV